MAVRDKSNMRENIKSPAPDGGGTMPAVRSDRWGVPLQTGNGAGVTLFDEGVEGLLSLSGEPVAAAEAAVAADDGLVLAHVLCAYFSLYRTSAQGVRSADEILKPLGTGVTLGEREILHLRAARSWVAGDWDEAAHSLERALLHDSQDLLALKVAQDLYFFLGQTRDLQSVVTRVLRAWPAEKRGWGYVQGMYAFGLEENGDYAQAELFARAALHHNPRDVWANHALAHVFEMEGRVAEGVRFLAGSAPNWSSSFFAIHTWWHQALYRIELAEYDAALSLYDGPIRGARSLEWIDVVDAASLLWRLSLFGVDVGDRSATLAADLAPLVDAPTYIFNDWHATMAFGLAGRTDLDERLVTANRRHAVGTNRAVAARAGLALLQGFSSFATGRFDRAVDALTDVRSCAHVMGGSNAQRDIVELTLIAAAARAGAHDVARQVVAERITKKPGAAAAAARLLAANAG
jgi:tetratricopeptide (TPR) repeat protein